MSIQCIKTFRYKRKWTFKFNVQFSLLDETEKKWTKDGIKIWKWTKNELILFFLMFLNMFVFMFWKYYV